MPRLTNPQTPIRRVSVSPKSLSNLMRAPGKKTRGSSLSPVTLDALCAHYKKYNNKGAAAEYIGFSKQYAKALFKKPGVKERLDILHEMELKPTPEALQQAAIKIEEEFKLQVSLVDKAMFTILEKGETHKIRGDADRVKAGEVIYRRTGHIEASRVSLNASAKAEANAAAAASQIDIYKPKWLRDHELQLMAETEAKYLPPPPSTLTVEQAAEYIKIADGNKDKARELARSDGHTF